MSILKAPALFARAGVNIQFVVEISAGACGIQEYAAYRMTRKEA